MMSQGLSHCHGDGAGIGPDFRAELAILNHQACPKDNTALVKVK